MFILQWHSLPLRGLGPREPREESHKREDGLRDMPPTILECGRKSSAQKSHRPRYHDSKNVNCQLMRSVEERFSKKQNVLRGYFLSETERQIA